MGLIATDELNVMPSDTEEKPTRKKPPQPQVPYKKLKQTQKARISRWMFEAVCKYYKEPSRCPRKNAWSLCAGNFIPNCMALLQRLPLKIYWRCFGKSRLILRKRIEKNGLPEPPKPKVKKTEAEKLAIKRARRRAKKKKLKAQQERLNDLPDWQDDRFFFIAGLCFWRRSLWRDMGRNGS